MPVIVAWGQVEHWLRASNAWVPLPGHRHQEIPGRLLIRLAGSPRDRALTGPLLDGDFAQFDGVRWVNPLERARPR